jgi:hypothetical protein
LLIVDQPILQQALDLNWAPNAAARVLPHIPERAGCLVGHHVHLLGLVGGPVQLKLRAWFTEGFVVLPNLLLQSSV